eukprot:4665797-Prymnesium_polylepis.1
MAARRANLLATFAPNSPPPLVCGRRLPCGTSAEVSPPPCDPVRTRKLPLRGLPAFVDEDAAALHAHYAGYGRGRALLRIRLRPPRPWLHDAGRRSPSARSSARRWAAARKPRPGFGAT